MLPIYNFQKCYIKNILLKSRIIDNRAFTLSFYNCNLIYSAWLLYNRGLLFLKGNKSGMYQREMGGAGELGRVEGGETEIMMYLMREEHIFSKKGKNIN